MLAQLRHMFRKEFLTFVRDPSSRSMLFAVPLLQLIVFTTAGTLEVENVRLAVLDRDAGVWSRELVQRMDAAGFVIRIVPVASDAELVHKIQHQEVLAAVVFQEDFSAALRAGRTSQLQIIVDGRRANAGQIAMSYLTAIVEGLNQELLGPDSMVASVETRHWFNPNLHFYWYMVTALAASLVMFTPMTMTTLSIARERELGTFDQLVVAPVTPSQIILGKMVPAVCVGLFTGVLITLMGVLIFEIPFRGSFPLLFFAMVVFVLSLVGMGLLASSLCNTQQQAMMSMFFVIMPLMVTSGLFTPTENMPVWLQYAGEANPLKHFIVVVQGSFLKSMDVGDIWRNTWPMMVIGCVTMATSIAIVWRRLH